MNPKLVEEVARAIAKADGKIAWSSLPEMMKYEFSVYAQAAIRVCMERAAEIATKEADKYEDEGEFVGEILTANNISDAIKREGGLT